MAKSPLVKVTCVQAPKMHMVKVRSSRYSVLAKIVKKVGKGVIYVEKRRGVITYRAELDFDMDITSLHGNVQAYSHVLLFEYDVMSVDKLLNDTLPRLKCNPVAH